MKPFYKTVVYKLELEVYGIFQHKKVKKVFFWKIIRTFAERKK